MNTRAFPTAIVTDVAVIGAIVCLTLVVAQSALAAQHPALIGPALLCDLTLTAAIAHWVLGVRWAKMPLWTVAPVAGAGFALAVFALPPSLRPSGNVLVGAVAAFELLAVGLALVRIKRLASGFLGAKREGAHFFAALEAGVVAVAPQLPALARWVRMETELLFFAVTGWFQRTPRAGMGAYAADAQLFSHHKKINWMTMAIVFAALSLIEGGVVHLVLWSKGWTTAAFIASGLHVYGIAWLFGDAHAIRLRPSVIRDGSLIVSLGWRAAATIDVDTVTSVAFGTWSKGDSEGDAGFAVVFGSANVVVTLSAPTPVRSVFRTKDVTRLYLQVDDPAALQTALTGDNGPH